MSHCTALLKKHRLGLFKDKKEMKGLASQCKAQEKYKERLDLGLTWLK